MQFVTKTLNDFIGPISEHSKVLNVGSANTENIIIDIFSEKKCDYVGVDINPGTNTNIVIDNFNSLPFNDNFFDISVSIATFESVKCFWITFDEMARVTRPGGKIFISAYYKSFPRGNNDRWRFLPDGFKALAKWNKKTECINSFIGARPRKDCFGLFKVK